MRRWLRRGWWLFGLAVEVGLWWWAARSIEELCSHVHTLEFIDARRRAREGPLI